MTDTISKSARSRNMSKIRGKDTKPELIVRKYLFHEGFRYRKNEGDLPGKPDIVLKKYKTAIFVNGCFWHRHDGCKYSTTPKTNSEFWKQKFEKTIERDKEEHDQLTKNGWKVIIIWECQLKKEERNETLKKLIDNLVVSN